MGHLTNAVGFRVGKSIPWALSAHHYSFDATRNLNLNTAVDNYFKKNFYVLFLGLRFKLLYSHVRVRPYRRFIRIAVFIFNGFFDIYIRRFRLTIFAKKYFLNSQIRHNFLKKASSLKAFYKSNRRYRQRPTKFYYKIFSKLISYRLRYDFRHLTFHNFSLQPIYVRLVHLTFKTITAKVLGLYIARRLRLGFSINRIIYPLLKEARRLSSFRGLFIKFKGRLTRKQRSSYNKRILKFGKIGFSTVMEHVDYSYTRYITRYGAASIKVWICRRPRFFRHYRRFTVRRRKKRARKNYRNRKYDRSRIKRGLHHGKRVIKLKKKSFFFRRLRRFLCRRTMCYKKWIALRRYRIRLKRRIRRVRRIRFFQITK